MRKAQTPRVLANKLIRLADNPSYWPAYASDFEDYDKLYISVKKTAPRYFEVEIDGKVYWPQPWDYARDRVEKRLKKVIRPIEIEAGICHAIYKVKGGKR